MYADSRPTVTVHDLDRGAFGVGQVAVAPLRDGDEHCSEWAERGGRADDAVQAVTKSLALSDPANVHNWAFRLMFQAEARIMQGEICEPSAMIGDVALMTSLNASKRIDQRISDLRLALRPWQRAKPVRELDQVISTYRGKFWSGSANTNRTYSG